jgi:hypothetical protein
MAGGAVLAPVVQRHAELVRKGELCRTSWLDFPLPRLAEDMQHLLEGLRVNTTRAFEILWLQIFYMLVGHWLPSYDPLLPHSSDFCKRSNT